MIINVSLKIRKSLASRLILKPVDQVRRIPFDCFQALHKCDCFGRKARFGDISTLVWATHGGDDIDTINGFEILVGDTTPLYAMPNDCCIVLEYDVVITGER